MKAYTQGRFRGVSQVAYLSKAPALLELCSLGSGDGRDWTAKYYTALQDKPCAAAMGTAGPVPLPVQRLVGSSGSLTHSQRPARPGPPHPVPGS